MLTIDKGPTTVVSEHSTQNSIKNIIISSSHDHIICALPPDHFLRLPPKLGWLQGAVFIGGIQVPMEWCLEGSCLGGHVFCGFPAASLLSEVVGRLEFSANDRNYGLFRLCITTSA